MIEPALSPDEPLRLRAVRDLNQLDTPLEERFERITRMAQRLLQTPIAAISMVDAGRQWFKSIQGLNVSETTRAVSFCGHTILDEEVLVVPDARIDRRFSDNPLVSGEPNIVFYAGCPIRTVDGFKLGSLCVIDQSPRALTHDDLETLRDLAAMAEEEFARSMRNAAQQELMAQVDAVARQAQVDGLTRVWNRTSIFELLDTEVARARRDGHGVGVIMADLDHFKQINDNFGHGAGDEVLRQTARSMLAAVREIDALGRYGGEEFLIALGPCDDLDGARLVAERIRARIAERPVKTEWGEISVTASLGVAFCDQATDGLAQTLVQAADRALYRAKHAGRNRVEIAPTTPGADSPELAA